MTENNAFFEELSLAPNSSLHDVEKRFLELVQERIQSIAETYDDNAMQAEEEWLRRFHESFFQYSIQWVGALLKTKQAHKGAEHPDAAKLKATAKRVLQDLQKNIISYALCYMRINRFSTLLRDETKAAEITRGATNIKKWTSDIDVAIARYKKQQKDILAFYDRIEDIRPVVQKIDSKLRIISQSTTELFGAEKSEPLMRSLNAALRTADKLKAERTLKNIAAEKKRFTLDKKTAAQLRTKIEKTGPELISCTLDNSKILEGNENKLYLKISELDMAYSNNLGNLKKAKEFLSKYHLPYMKHKVDNLSQLKDKLLVIGTLDTLMALYIKLIKGIVTPITDIQSIRSYENDVVNKVTYLLETQFKETENITERAQAVVKEFRQSCEELENIEKMKLDEISI